MVSSCLATPPLRSERGPTESCYMYCMAGSTCISSDSRCLSPTSFYRFCCALSTAPPKGREGTGAECPQGESCSGAQKLESESVDGMKRMIPQTCRLAPPSLCRVLSGPLSHRFHAIFLYRPFFDEWCFSLESRTVFSTRSAQQRRRQYE